MLPSMENDQPSTVPLTKFLPYFTLPVKKIIPKIAGTEASLIPVPVGIPFLAYYHNKKLVDSWIYYNDRLKSRELPRLKPDIGTQWLKSKVPVPHHEFFIGVITVFKDEYNDKLSVPEFVRQKILNPDCSETSLRYIATAMEYSVLTDVCVPPGDPQWQMRTIHMHRFRSAVQLSIKAKAARKKVPNIDYQHLSGGTQIKSCRLDVKALDKHLEAATKTVKTYARWPLAGFKIVTDKQTFLLNV